MRLWTNVFIWVVNKMKTVSDLRRRYLGFTLIEIIIVVAIAALLVRFGYSSYTSYQIRQNRELAKQELAMAAAAMEKYYSESGQYTTSANQWPSGIFESKVYGGSGLVYAISLPNGVVQTAQNFSVIATPQQGTIQANDGNICLDRQGRFTWPASGTCGLAVAEVPAAPPSTPVNSCLGKTQGGACSAGCVAGEAYWACSGDCNGVLICNGAIAPTGCSGHCNNTYIYVRVGSLLGNAACNGECAGAVLNVPSDWASRTPVCHIASGSTANCICNTATNGSCDNITIVYHDSD